MAPQARTSNQGKAARRRAIRRGQGTSHTCSLLAIFVLVLTAGALAPAAALAAGTSRSVSGAVGAFEAGPTALAVDQSNGDVYAVSGSDGHRIISRFTAAGAPHNFTAGPAAGTNTLSGSTERVLSVAIDNSGGPLDGDIYVSEGGGGTLGKVEVFANDGASLGAINGTGTGGGGFNNNSICGVAVDQSSGAVYVSMTLGSVTTGNIWRYTPNSPSGSISDSDYTLTGISADHPCNLAADSGNVYVQRTSDRALVKYSASSFSSDFSTLPVPTTIDTGSPQVGVAAVAVDPKTGEVYADEGNRIAVFNPGGALLYRFGLSAYFGGRSGGVALKSAASGPASSVYVADPRSNARIVVFGAVTKVQTFSSPEIANFAPDGSSESTFNLRLGQLAFDQATRRLYALSPGALGIYGLDASNPPAYTPLAGFTPLPTATGGETVGLAVDNTTLGSAGNLYLAAGDTNLLYGWGSDGSPLGGAFPLDPALNPGPPNGSPKNLCGAAVDSASNVWVANSSTKRILEYSSAGASLAGTIDTSAEGRPCQLTLDSNDDLYVNIDQAGTGNGVWKYTAASGYSAATMVAEESARALAVDPSTDHLYVLHLEEKAPASNGWVDEYDSAGNLINEFGTSLGGVRGITVDATNHYVYVAEGTARKIYVFGPSVLLPEVIGRPVSDVTNTTATLNGTVITQEVALEDCHFEYVSEAAFRIGGFSDLSSGGSVPCSPAAGSIPLDLEEHAISASATGLSENTAYRFRLSATNANGTVSEDEKFSSAGPPLVETTGSPLRGATTARLEGRVDPSGEATTYHFEYGTQGPCDANPCESTELRAAGSGREIELVAQSVEGLAPDTTYHYRLIADNGNASGFAVGQDMTVNTRASDQPLSHGHFPGPPGSDRAWEQVNLPDTGGNPTPFAFGVSDNGERAFYEVHGGTPLSSTGSTFSSLYAERTPSGWRSEDIYPPREQLVAASWLAPTGMPDLSDQVATNFNNVSGAETIWRLRPGRPAVRIFQSEPVAFADEGIASEDASRVLVRREGTRDPAHPVSGNRVNLYDVSSGTLRLISLMPDGSVSPCDSNIPTYTRTRHWVSPDGSLAFFQSCSRVYLRNFDTEQTKLIGEGGFIKLISGAAFFATNVSFDPDDTGGTDIYRYDLDSETRECVTCVVPGLQAEVQDVAIPADGSRVYFTSSNPLVPGAPGHGIYRVKVASGEIAYVASSGSIGEEAGLNQAISPDGSTLIFASSGPDLNALGGQQNGGTQQYYRYDDRDRSLTCLSCPQDGSAAAASSAGADGLVSGGNDAKRLGANKTALSADGATFAFVTPLPLVPADQNTARSGQDSSVGLDVYEWRDGRVLLITDGLTNWPGSSSAPQLDAVTPSGRDVFFTAPVQYTPDALDGYRRLYDARVGGGIEFPVPPKPCPLEVCQGTPKGAPEERAPGTGTFAGPGNAQQRAHHKKKQHKKKSRRKKSQHKKKSQQQAKHDRRNAR